jgi:hypothetical protein
MSDNQPSTTGNGRDGGGRFAPGNQYAKGNPHAAHVARLRAALLHAVSPDDMREVVAKLVEKAKTGDVPAVRELIERTTGRVLEADLLDRLERLENALEELAQQGRL